MIVPLFAQSGLHTLGESYNEGVSLPAVVKELLFSAGSLLEIVSLSGIAMRGERGSLKVLAGSSAARDGTRGSSSLSPASARARLFVIYRVSPVYLANLRRVVG